MNRRRSTGNSSLLGRWVLLTTAGGGLAGLLEGRFEFLGLIVLTGVVVGFFQWLLFRTELEMAWIWWLIWGIGWPITFSIESGLIDPFTSRLIDPIIASGFLWETFWVNVAQFAAVLFLIAILQAIYLFIVIDYDWPARLGISLLWIVVNPIAGGILGGASAALCAIGCDWIGNRLWVGLYLGAGGWLGYAICSGLVLLTFPRNRSIF